MRFVVQSIEDATSQGISDMQLVYSRTIQLKEERAIFERERCILSFTSLPTDYGKSLIYQVFVQA